MTAPLTPSDSDLQDFPFMPLHVARLRDSDLAAEATPDACWYAVLLWAVAWHQLPAGSLPDNDPILTKLIGLGRDVKTFRKHRDGALRGFVKCSDGRLYHPVVAEQVIIAWNGKLQQRWRTECARIKKANQRSGTEHPSPTFEEFMASTHGPIRPDDVPEDVPEDTAECPSGQSLQGKGKGKGKGIEERDTDVSLSPDGDVKAAFEAYNDLARRMALPVAKALNAQRKRQIRRRLDEGGGLAGWQDALAAIERSKFCLGLRGDGWTANLDFVCQPGSFQKLIEGAYGADAAPVPPDGGSPGHAWPGPPEIRLAVIDELGSKGEDFARNYLDPAGWRNGPDRLVVCRSNFAKAKLDTAVGHVLEGLDVGTVVEART